MNTNSEQPDMEFAQCRYNHGVICGSKDHCDKCGWNPRVARIRQQMLQWGKTEGVKQHEQ